MKSSLLIFRRDFETLQSSKQTLKLGNNGVITMTKPMTLFAIGAAIVSVHLAAYAQHAGQHLPGDRLFPEGIATTSDGRIFIGSFTGGTILETDASGQTRTFIPAGQNGLVSVVGLMSDEENNLLYACSSDPGIGDLTGNAAPALTAFDLETGASVARYELPAGGFCNDITQAPDGSIYVTDSFNPRILKLDTSTSRLKEWVTDSRFEGEGFNLNGLAFANNAIYTVKHNSGELFEIPVERDGSAGSVEIVPIQAPLQNPDGLIAISNEELLVVEGAGNVQQICLTQYRGQFKMIASSLDVPTSIAISGKNAYIVESQFDHLFDPAVSKTKPDVFRVAVVPLT